MRTGACSTGRREIKSTATTFTENVSYGYPGGMNVKPINSVILRPH